MRHLVDLVELGAAEEAVKDTQAIHTSTDQFTAVSDPSTSSNIMAATPTQQDCMPSTSSNITAATSTHQDRVRTYSSDEDMRDAHLDGFDDVPVSSITELHASQVSLPDLSASQMSLPELQLCVDELATQCQTAEDSNDKKQLRIHERLTKLKLPVPTKGNPRNGECELQLIYVLTVSRVLAALCLGKEKKKLARLQITESEGFGMPITDVILWCRHSSYLQIVFKVLQQFPSVITSRRIPIAGRARQSRAEGMHPYTIQKSAAAKMLAAISTKQDRDKERDDFVEYEEDAEDPQIIYFAHDGVNATIYNT
jgi:hypothetical protein